MDKIKLSDYTGYDIDLSNVTERELSIAKMFAPYVTLDDYVEDNNIKIKFPKILCNTWQAVINFHKTSILDKLKANDPDSYTNGIINLSHSTTSECELEKDAKKDIHCVQINNYTPCRVTICVYYKFLKTYHMDEYIKQRQKYIDNKIDVDKYTPIAGSNKIQPYITDLSSIEEIPYIPYYRIQEIIKDLDDNASEYKFDDVNISYYKYKFCECGQDDKIPIRFDSLVYYITNFNKYINNIEKQTKYVNEFYDDQSLYILQYSFIRAFRGHNTELFKNYLEYVKNNPELEEVYNKNIIKLKKNKQTGTIAGTNYYGYVAGNDREEVYDVITNKVFFLSESFKLENNYIKYTAIDCAQTLAKVSSSQVEHNPIKYSTFEENKIYVITGLTEFIKSYKDTVERCNYAYPLRRQFEHFLKQLCAFNDKTFVILAGTLDEIHELFELNEAYSVIYGENDTILEDKTIDELYDIYKDNVSANSNIILLDKEKEQFYDYITYNRGSFPFNNTTLAKYLANYSITHNEFVLPDNLSINRELDFMRDLDEFVGMDNIKESIKKFYNFVKYRQAAKEQGIEIEDTNLHMIFTGNPGTGKTSIARIIAKALYNIGIIKKNKLVEVERKDLIGQYIGQTAPKTAEIIEKALDGVLFIDEAYSLVPEDSGRDFGQEAIATIIKAMEDKKDRLVVIFAGYKYEMERFIESNPGIQSRIGYTFHFDDYEPDQLFEIFIRKIKKSNLVLDTDCAEPIKNIMTYFAEAKFIGNGRFVDKIYQMTLQNKAEDQSSNLTYITKDCIPTIQDIINTLPQKDYLIDPTEVSVQDKQYVVYHELGHAIVACILDVYSIKEISITVNSQNALGHVLFDTSKDNLLKTSNQLRNTICMGLAGLAAEKIKFNNYTNGGTSDIEKSIRLAERMIFDYGMSSLGFGAIYYKDKLDNRIFEEINNILNDEFQRATDILTKNINILDALYEKLIQNEKLSIEEIKEFIKLNS